jgi:hypothetical protein
MIYLKKNEETQIVNIPKNGDYKGKLTYEEGFNAGYTDGLNEGREKPYSTKGFFFENGEKEFIYPVKIDRDTMLQISFLGGNTSDYVEISFYPMGNGCVLANQNDSFIVCAMRGDFLRVLIYNNLQFELPCKQEKWHTLRLYTDRVILDGEETYFNTPYTGGSTVCACVNRGGNGFYRGLIQYMKGVEDKVVMYYISNLDEGGFKRLRSDNGISDWYENNFVPVWGVFPVHQFKVPLNSVFINVEGGNVCPELTVLDVDSNGRYEGAFSAVNVNVPDVNGSYDEGYNNGYNDGLNAGGGSCNIEETRWAEPTPADVDGSGYLVYYKSEGYDGMDRVALNMNGYNALKYNEGYEAGKAEGGDCPELTELNVTENGTYTGAYNKVNVDVPQEGNINSSTVEKEYNTIALRTENIHDSDIILDRTQLVGRGDEYTENGFISYTQNKNGIVISGSDEVGAKYVTKIRKGALNWNTIEYFYSYTIANFGVDMTRDTGSNLARLYIKYNGGVGTGADSDIYFRTGCFATSSRLSKIIFYEPYYINVEDKAFEGVDYWGNVVVVGEDNAENRAKYDTLMAQLGGEWTLTFVDEYYE